MYDNLSTSAHHIRTDLTIFFAQETSTLFVSSSLLSSTLTPSGLYHLTDRKPRVSVSCNSQNISSSISAAIVNMPVPQEFLKYVDDNAEAFVQRLADAVEIPR